MRKLVLAAALSVFGFGFAAAQTQNRAEDFVLTEFADFGDWELFCGYFVVPERARCDLRNATPYIPPPNLRAVVVYWEVAYDRPFNLRIDVESYSHWGRGGFQMAGEDESWVPTGCVVGPCRPALNQAARLQAGLMTGQTATLRVVDYGLEKHELTWDNSRFPEAWAAFLAAAKTRNLEVALP